MDSEMIERYVANELQGEEKILFEEKLKSDNNLKAEVEAYRAIVADLRSVQNQQLKERLIQLEKKSFQIESSASNTKLYFLATTIVLLSAISYFVYNKYFNPTPKQDLKIEQSLPTIQENPTPSADPIEKIDTSQLKQNQKNPPKRAIAEKKQNQQDEQLYALHFQPYQDEDLMSMTRSDAEQSNYEKFISLYLAKDYKNALISYNSIDESLRDSDNLLFLKANVLVMLGRVKEGRDLFEQIISNGESKYIEQAKHALNNLKNN
jgi:TolA-binding protein